MEVIYTPQAVEDLKFWKKSGNKAIQQKIQKLILAVIENPYEGVGKPEALKHELSGSWSRRISQEHRLIYEIIKDDEEPFIEIQSLRGHY